MIRLPEDFDEFVEATVPERREMVERRFTDERAAGQTEDDACAIAWLAAADTLAEGTITRNIAIYRRRGGIL